MSIRDERKQQSRQALLDATLSLSSSGLSFSSMSLREITRTVGLVPAAFYRHFQDKDQLGLELVDRVALQLKRVLHQLKLATLFQPDANIDEHLSHFLSSVQQHPEWWIFFSAERWGGSPVLRQAIAREIDSLIDDLSHDLSQVKLPQHLYSSQDLHSLASILINQSLNWAMSWINLSLQGKTEIDSAQQLQFKQQTQRQIQLLFGGIAHVQPAYVVKNT
ncbi:TetR family transcriptional regulator [Acinetobacter zhairhuonensis]|uniref:TetR family transcriptional regulator n=1 Tax=Acinetobacter sp. A7.4 TaxID=2919921 RepID=UPI001F4F59C5|nr:TetR family transcriptional regulator [Acinetobacter sp. A7.4]MCJ8161571.1 TetR family transcriptional regulator [Acinetobacter sp. A7.4]